MKITQKNNPEILIKIKEFLNFGKCDKYNYYVENFEDCKKLVILLKPNLIIKYNQIIAFEEYLDTQLEKNEKYNEIIHNKREKIYKIINMEKHQIEIYQNNNNDNSIEGFNKKINEEIEKNNFEKKIKKELYYNEKSILMSGENHMYYGKTLSDNHALNISISTTHTKRSKNPNLSNEKIREIYKLKDKIMQKDVAEKYNMNREIVRRIWNRIIIPTDDNEFLIKKENAILNKNIENNILTFNEKISIGKRILLINEYIEILKWKIKKENSELLEDKSICSTNLASYLAKLWNKKVTTDIIKNIWNGRTKLFEFELENKEILYKTYLEIIKSK